MMATFCFDVGGVIIRDNLAPDNALNVFRHLSQLHSLNADEAYATYVGLQPSLDLGTTSLYSLCAALRIEQRFFEDYWVSIHPADLQVVDAMDRLLGQGHHIGLATNMCRRLLDLLITNTPILKKASICCSSDLGIVKPSSAFFTRVSEIMNAREIIFIDDREANINVARRVGWTAIHAKNGWISQFRTKYLDR